VARWSPDLVNVHYASGYGTLATLAGVHPRLLSVWGSDVYEFPDQGWLPGWLLRRNLRRADAIASTSRAMAQRVRELTPERRAIAITPFGVDMEAFAPVDADIAAGVRSPHADVLPLADSSASFGVTVGTVKSLAPVYGIDLLLRAFAGLCADPRIPADCRLLIVGDGPQRAELEALAGKLGIAARTGFAGAVPHADVPSWLHRLDIYVAASRAESFGVAVVEASACGLPVVVSDAGGLPEVVRDGETGLVVPVGDVDALRTALATLVLDPTRRARMGAAGREFVSQEYAWPACLARMEAAYRHLLAAPRSVS
jgi:glycosyltransferase involved in cell wall biosynthesis